MAFKLSLDNAIENIAKIVGSRSSHEAYHVDYLNWISQNFNFPMVVQNKPILCFNYDESLEYMAYLYDQGRENNARKLYSQSDFSLEYQDEATQLYHQALALIENYDSTQLKLYNLLVGRLYFQKHSKTYSGSNLHSLGVVLLALPDENRNPPMLAEAIMHETYHQFLFLDELCNSFFVDEDVIGYKEQFGLIEPMTKRILPFRIICHSLLISLNTFRFYDHLPLEHKTQAIIDRVDELRYSFQCSYEGFLRLVEHKQPENLFSEHGLAMLASIKRQAEALPPIGEVEQLEISL